MLFQGLDNKTKTTLPGGPFNLLTPDLTSYQQQLWLSAKLITKVATEQARTSSHNKLMPKRLYTLVASMCVIRCLYRYFLSMHDIHHFFPQMTLLSMDEMILSIERFYHPWIKSFHAWMILTDKNCIHG